MHKQTPLYCLMETGDRLDEFLNFHLTGNWSLITDNKDHIEICQFSKFEVLKDRLQLHTV